MLIVVVCFIPHADGVLMLQVLATYAGIVIYKIQRHVQNVMLVRMASKISKSTTYKVCGSLNVVVLYFLQVFRSSN